MPGDAARLFAENILLAVALFPVAVVAAAPFLMNCALSRQVERELPGPRHRRMLALHEIMLLHVVPVDHRRPVRLGVGGAGDCRDERDRAQQTGCAATMRGAKKRRRAAPVRFDLRPGPSDQSSPVHANLDSDPPDDGALRKIVAFGGCWHPPICAAPGDSKKSGNPNSLPDSAPATGASAGLPARRGRRRARKTPRPRSPRCRGRPAARRESPSTSLYAPP